MKSNYRPGSMGAAEEKSTRRFFIGASIVVAVLLMLWVLPIPTYAHAYFLRASAISKIAGLIVAAAWYWFLWVKSADMMTKSGDRGTQSIILLIGLVLMLCLLSGFNFSLDGIEK